MTGTAQEKIGTISITQGIFFSVSNKGFINKIKEDLGYNS